ncbi:MAG TPA: ChbG/HpnK family deacetylase [Gemmataceae bacterium]|nr:ChbG/HpnK family deacetylase [Gemmataceae bacterium]
MHTLIVTADDFGISPGTVAGILEAMREGWVAATSAMVCEPADRQRVADAAGVVPGRIGLHLQLTDGRPVSQSGAVPSLVDRDGRFPAHPSSAGQIDPGEVLAEWRAQLGLLRELGVEPSHLDSHHHAHTLPGALEAYVELARETGLRARGGRPLVVRRLRAAGVRCVDACEMTWTGTGRGAETLIHAVTGLVAGAAGPRAVELVAHPGHPDDELRRRSNVIEARWNELRVLSDPELPARLIVAGFQLADITQWEHP